MCYNMEIHEFIKDVYDNLLKECQTSTEKLLIQDIIMIYNKFYDNYEDYKHTIIEGNRRIDEVIKMGLTYTIHPRHIILDEEIYNFILSLKLLYK